MLARRNGGLAERAPAALERLRAVPAFLDAARDTLDEPPSVFVDTTLGMLGGGGELVVQLVAALEPESPDAARRSPRGGGEGAGSAQALRHRAPGRDRARLRPARVRDGRGSVQPPAAPRARADRQRARAVALRASPPGGDRGRAGRAGGKDGCAAVARAGRGAAERRTGPGRLLPVYRAELDRAHAFVAERELVSIPHDPVDVVPTPVVPGGAGALRRLRAAADLSLRQQTGRFYVTQPDASAAAGGARPPAPGPLPARDPRDGGARGVSRPSPPAGHGPGARLAKCGGTSGRRSWWRAGRSTVSSSWTRSGYYGEDHARLFQLVNLLWRAIRIVLDVGLHTRGMTPAEAVDLHGGAPADRAGERGGRGAALLRVARPTSSATRWGGASCSGCATPTASARAHRSAPTPFHDELLAYGGLPVSLARWGMELGE